MSTKHPLYYVRIGSVNLYWGRSGEKSELALLDALNIMKSVGGTGTIAFFTPDTMGTRAFVEGKEKGVEG